MYKLVPLLNHRLNHRVEEIDSGSGGRTRILFIEGQEANYQLLYPSMDRQEAASCFGSFYTPGITSREAARQFNEAQSRMARALTDQQIESDKAAVEALNQSIADLNHRVIQVLSQTTGVAWGPWPFTCGVAVALPRSSRAARTPLDEHWCFRLRSLACVHFAQPDPLLSSWMSSSPA